MSNRGKILKEIEENKIALKAGTEFYYADIKSKKPIKCVIQKIELGYPATIFAKREDTNEVFRCDSLDNYDNAYVDAQIQEDRIIY